jgi:hypothetical protein
MVALFVPVVALWWCPVVPSEGMGEGESLEPACGPMTMMLSGTIYLLEGVILSPSSLLPGEPSERNP